MEDTEILNETFSVILVEYTYLLDAKLSPLFFISIVVDLQQTTTMYSFK